MIKIIPPLIWHWLRKSSVKKCISYLSFLLSKIHFESTKECLIQILETFSPWNSSHRMSTFVECWIVRYLREVIDIKPSACIPPYMYTNVLCDCACMHLKYILLLLPAVCTANYSSNTPADSVMNIKMFPHILHILHLICLISVLHHMIWFWGYTNNDNDNFLHSLIPLIKYSMITRSPIICSKSYLKAAIDSDWSS